MEALSSQAFATLLITLRIVPTLAFSPPFTLLRVPGIVRVLLSIALSAAMVGGHPAETWQAQAWQHAPIATAGTELLLGIGLALSLQFAFAALLTIGRAIDIQAAFGLAVLVDPTTRSQLPLVGTIFAYATGAIFFAGGGPADLLAIWSASIDQIPLGTLGVAIDIPRLAAAISSLFVIACGLGGALMLALFLCDLAIAFMSRTLPQMNVLLLGFQVKGLVTLALLPTAVGLGGALFVRLVRTALDAMPYIVTAR